MRKDIAIRCPCMNTVWGRVFPTHLLPGVKKKQSMASYSRASIPALSTRYVAGPAPYL